jgi:hypothetical protein
MTGAVRPVLKLAIPQRLNAVGLSAAPNGDRFLYAAYEVQSDPMQFEHFQ